MIRIDMDMPKNCYDCKFCHGIEYGYCVLMDEELNDSLSPDMFRPEWCPLLPDVTTKKKILVEKTKQDSWKKEAEYYRALDNTSHEMGCW